MISPEQEVTKSSDPTHRLERLLNIGFQICLADYIESENDLPPSTQQTFIKEVDGLSRNRTIAEYEEWYALQFIEFPIRQAFDIKQKLISLLGLILFVVFKVGLKCSWEVALAFLAAYIGVAAYYLAVKSYGEKFYEELDKIK